MSENNVHEGHRQRLKNRFIETGFQGFEPHNILELLLFYSIPRKDTNVIAHNLLNRFGSLKNVFNASFEDLIQVEGIKENSATLIKMVPLIAKEYVDSSLTKNPIFDTANKIGEYFVNKYMDAQNEIVYIMLLSNKFELLSVEKIHEGNVSSAHVSTRKIIELTIRHNASMVVLAHNHPGGTICPSLEDINTTASLMTALNNCEILLLEHFVIAGNEFCPIINNTEGLRDRGLDAATLAKGKIDLKF